MMTQKQFNRHLWRLDKLKSQMGNSIAIISDEMRTILHKDKRFNNTIISVEYQYALVFDLVIAVSHDTARTNRIDNRDDLHSAVKVTLGTNFKVGQVSMQDNSAFLTYRVYVQRIS